MGRPPGQHWRKDPEAEERCCPIKPGDEKTYAEILGEIKKQVKPEDLKSGVKEGRKTKGEDVMVVVEKNKEGMGPLEKAIQAAVETAGTVRSMLTIIN